MAKTFSVEITNVAQCFRLLTVEGAEQACYASVLDYIAENGSCEDFIKVIQTESWKTCGNDISYELKFGELLLADGRYKAVSAVLRFLHPGADTAQLRMKCCGVIVRNPQHIMQVLQHCNSLELDEARLITSALLQERLASGRATQLIVTNARFGHTLLTDVKLRECYAYCPHEMHWDLERLLTKGRTFYSFGKDVPDRTQPLTDDERAGFIKAAIEMHGGFIAYELVIGRDARAALREDEFVLLSGPAVTYALKEQGFADGPLSVRRKKEQLQNAPVANFLSENQRALLNG